MGVGLLFCSSIFQIYGQSIESLREPIRQIIADKQASVGIAISGNAGKDTLSINGENRFPMQSVFKFPIALVVLHQIDEGKLTLKQKINITQQELLPDLYSPLRDQYPKGTVMTVSKLMEYMVSQSDNVACDVLLRKVGGPKVVEDFFIANGFKNIAVRINEETQQSNWDLQYQNWMTPIEANNILAVFYSNQRKLLSAKAYAFIWKIMKATSTGPGRIRGQLPKNTIVAHKTGSSGTNKAGLTAAVNDIGVVFLPNGKYFYISLFVSDSKENNSVNEKIIADIAKLAWDYFKK